MFFRLLISLHVFAVCLILASGCSRNADTQKTGSDDARPPIKPGTDGTDPVRIAKNEPPVSKEDPRPEPKDGPRPPEKKNGEGATTPVTPTPLEDQGKKPPAKDPKDPKETKETPKDPPAPEFVPPASVMGKSYEQWRKEIKSKDPTRREIAIRTIVNFGPDKAYEALPDILSELRKHTLTNPVDLSVRANGITAVAAILASKKEPEQKHIDDAFALFKMFMKDEQVPLRIKAVQGIRALGPKAHEAIEDVIRVAQDPDTWEVRKEGLTVLTQMALEKNELHPKVPGVLRKALDDAAIPVRLLGLHTLSAVKGRLDKKEMKFTIDRLNLYLKTEKDPVMLILTHAAIMTITEDVGEHLAPVAKMLKHKELRVRVQALEVIDALGPKALAVIDDVITMVQEAEDPEVRQAGLTAVLKIGFQDNQFDPKAVAHVCSVLDDTVPELRMSALTALSSGKPALGKKETADAVQKLSLRALKEKEPIVQIWIQATIMTLKEQVSKPHLDPVVKHLYHKELDVRLQAFQVIALAGKDAKPFVLDDVLTLVKDSDLTVASAALDVLPELHAFETMPMLKKLIEDKKTPPELRVAAEEAWSDLEDIMTIEKNRKEKSKKEPDKK